MITIYIDNKPYQCEGEGKNLLAVCLSLGFDIPYFCWHPAMHSVGACRQCAVKLFKDEKDTKGKIVMSCMTPAVDGIRISIDDPEAVNFRARVIEWLMVNHPHDCPVCDEGGECHLQDMTVMAGHAYRRFRFRKRTHRNQNLGPFVNHEMNRCIQCYRCVRFYRDYAGGRDLDVFGWHDHIYFGRHEDGVLENEFSGNLVEVCPTGVFTDKTLKSHYTRKWDLQTAPSICVHCGLGCNTIPGERYDMLRRIHSRYNGKVNGFFLCDRGRYGYEFVNSDRRIRQPLLLGKAVTKEAILEHIRPLLQKGNVIGIGSPRASLEANFALQSLVGSDHFYHGVSENEFQLVSSILKILQSGPSRTPSMRETELADAVFVLGEDVTNTAPMLALSLRQQDHSPFFISTPDQTKLDDLATATYRATPDEIARLGFAVAHEIDPDAPSVPNLPEPAKILARRIAESLKNAKRPLVVSGTSCASESVIQAAANVAWALNKTGHIGELCFTVPECNSLGLGLMAGKSIDSIDPDGSVDTVIILENDIYRRMSKSLADALLEKAGHVIVLDHLTNPTTAASEVVLPVAAFTEAEGTLVNNEGRGQRFFQVFVPKGTIQESWRWLGDMMEPKLWPNVDAVMSAMGQTFPIFKKVPEIAPPAGFRLVGQKIPRQPHRYSGRTAMTANVDVHEPQPPDDPDAPMSFSMEGYSGEPPSSLIPRFWSPGWNSVQAVNKFQIEVNGPLHGGDPGLRLIEPSATARISYFGKAPDAFVPRKDQWLIIPAWHIFGSEELSILSGGIAQRTPKPYLAINFQDAENLALKEGQEVKLSIDNEDHILVLKIKAELPAGIALVPAGLRSLSGIIFPAWGKIKK
ncbi:MAG: NADH-quinone oxidoreductase subunit NuoG [Phycisphaerae bacterium]